MADVEFLEDVFDERFCTFLLDDARARLKDSSEFRRSNFHWDQAIRRASAVVLVRDYVDPLRSLILQQLIDRAVIAHRNYSVMNYAWTPLSYIPWHSDDHREQAITVYLNNPWDMNWGGLFLYRTADRQIRGYAPRFNCGVRNSDKLEHSTTPVMFDAPEPRFTIQLFATKAE